MKATLATLSVLGCVKQLHNGMPLGALDHAELVCARSARVGMLQGQEVLAHWRRAGMMLWVPFVLQHEDISINESKTGEIEAAKGNELPLRAGEFQPQLPGGGGEGDPAAGTQLCPDHLLPPSQST